MMTKTLTILLVESNCADAQRVLEMLQKVEAFKFQLFHFFTVNEMLSYLRDHSELLTSAVILLDLPLSDTQAVTQLLQESPDIPIVAISDLKEEAQVIQALHNSAFEYLVKSQVDGQLLAHSIHYAIDKQKMQQQLNAAQASLARLTEQIQQLEQEKTLLEAIVNSMRESEAKFRTLYESTSAAVLLFDENGIFDANSAALQMFGCSHLEQICSQIEEKGSRENRETKEAGKIRLLLPCPPSLHLPQPQTRSRCIIGFSPPLQPNGQDSLKLVNEYIATAITQGSCRFEWIYRKCNGEDFPAEVTLTLIELGNRKVLQAAIYNIAERKITETQLVEAKESAEAGSRAKSEFLATISHELRTPLNAILGLSAILRQEIFGSLNEKQKEYITCIHSSGEHLLALINDLLDLSKVEAGKEELSFVLLNIQELCEYCLTMVREQAYEQRLKLNFIIDPQADICIVDERRCKQMLLNLLSNAVKFTLVGEVSLIVRKLPQGIAFIVEDTGIGIAAQKLPLLFEPFQQLDSGLNRQFPGTGLGLALTRSLARLHGGDVTVESEVGKGSKFTLYLPDLPSEDLLFSASSEDSRQTEGLSCSLTGRCRILLVEHDERSAMLLKDYLEVIGHRVEHLTNTADFLNSVHYFKPDLIFMAVNLRGNYTGFDLLATLRRDSDTKQIRVVMVTDLPITGDGAKRTTEGNWASLTLRNRELCLEAGADDYLIKPIGIAQLEAILMRYL